jgi:hypothetical protein
MNIVSRTLEYIFLDLFSNLIAGVVFLILNLLIYFFIKVIFKYIIHGKNILLIKWFIIKYLIFNIIGVLLSSVIMLIINNYISLEDIIHLTYNFRTKLFLVYIILSLMTCPFILCLYNKINNRITAIIIMILSICIICQHLFSIYFGRILLYAT